MTFQVALTRQRCGVERVSAPGEMMIDTLPVRKPQVCSFLGVLNTNTSPSSFEFISLLHIRSLYSYSVYQINRSSCVE